MYIGNHVVEMLIRDLLRSAAITDSNLLSDASTSDAIAFSRESEFYNYSVFPDYRLTDWISVYVSATLAVLPSHTSCHDRVSFSKLRASLCFPNLDLQVAMLR
jgi:hypothetical protein